MSLGLDGEAGQQRCVPGDVGGLSVPQGIAAEHAVQLAPLQNAGLGGQTLHDECRDLCGCQIPQAAAQICERGTRSVYKYYFSHGVYFLLVFTNFQSVARFAATFAVSFIPIRKYPDIRFGDIV